MAIEVQIKRATHHQDSAKILLPHIIELRAHAVKQPGYISGETFFNLDCPEECIVISRWIAIEHWQKWVQNPHRIELDGKMAKHLAIETEYSTYGIGLW